MSDVECSTSVLLIAIKNNFGFESSRNKSDIENPKSEI